MSGDFPGFRSDDRDPMNFAFGEELQAEPEPEPPFWPKLLLVGAAIGLALGAVVVWVV